MIFYEKIVCDDSISRAYFQYMILSEVYRQARGKSYKVSRWKHYFSYKKKKNLVCKNSPIFRSPKIGGICEISYVIFQILLLTQISKMHFESLHLPPILGDLKIVEFLHTMHFFFILKIMNQPGHFVQLAS